MTLVVTDDIRLLRLQADGPEPPGRKPVRKAFPIRTGTTHLVPGRTGVTFWGAGLLWKRGLTCLLASSLGLQNRHSHGRSLWTLLRGRDAMKSSHLSQ